MVRAGAEVSFPHGSTPECSGNRPDALASPTAVAASVAEAERHEFVRGDLESALRLYKRALNRLPQAAVAERAFLLTRTGRTLFKLRRFAEGVEQYTIVEGLSGDAVDRNGLPYGVIALLQIIDGCTLLRRPDDLAAAQSRFVRYVLDHPWDLDNGYGQQLTRVLDYVSPSDTVDLSEATALDRQTAAKRVGTARIERRYRDGVG
jgi:tetratricopeptide (TPR) repeat protein